MRLRIEDYAGKPRDTQREHALIRSLRGVPEDQAWHFIQDMLRQDQRLGLLLAKSVLHTPALFQSLLEQGIQQADASAIEHWLACCVPKIGARQAMTTLKKQLMACPSGVEKALYWMPKFLPKTDPKSIEALQDLKSLVLATLEKR